MFLYITYILCTSVFYFILYVTGVTSSLCGRGDEEHRFPVLFFMSLLPPLFLAPNVLYFPKILSYSEEMCYTLMS